MLLKTDPHVWPGLYQLVIGLSVSGEMGGFLWSKLKTPGSVSCSSCHC